MPLPVVQPTQDHPAVPEIERRVISVTAGAVDLRWLGLTLFWPAVDLRSGALDWWPASLLAGGYGLVAALGSLPLARASDRLGRKATLAVMTAVFAVAALGLAWGPALLAPWCRVAMGLAAA